MIGCLEEEIDSSHLSTMWLLERRLMLDYIGVLLGSSEDIAALHRYLPSQGGRTTKLVISFRPVANLQSLTTEQLKSC